jgi:superfamily I DNA/RNA helicase
MARRIAWWVGVEGVPKDQIIAFTFTERAAEEMKMKETSLPASPRLLHAESSCLDERHNLSI